MNLPPTVRKIVNRPEFGPFVLFVVLLIAFSLVHPKYLSILNVSNLMAFTPELGIIALGMTLLMTSGEFDLSVGSVFGFSAVVMWILFNEFGVSLAIAFVIALAVWMGISLSNGLFTTRLKIPSFLVTLGMLLVVRGTAQYITSGFPQRVFKSDAPLANILVGEFWIGDMRLHMSVLWFAFFAIVLAFVLTMAKFGNWTQASGGNPSSARARGVRVNATKVVLFVLTAFLAGWAGITSSIRTLSANPNAGFGFELEVIAMVVIGGTALGGGRGTILGTIFGVLILRMVRNAMPFVGVPALAYSIFVGAIILGMMALQTWLARRQMQEA